MKNSVLKLRFFSSPSAETLLVFLSALALRLVFVFQWTHLPYYSNLLADAQVHQQWALEILGGQLARHAAFYQSPFYPYLLALVYKIFGTSPLPMLLIQAFASALACVAVARLAARCFDEKAGLTAGLIAALYSPFVLYSALLLKETWAVLGFALFCLAAVRALDSGKWTDAFLCGLAGGWTALSRGNALLLLPVLPAFWLLRRGGNIRPKVLIPVFALGALLPILPVTLHNYRASRNFVPVNYTGGFVFYLGNNGKAVGAMDYPSGISSNAREEEKQAAALAEAEAGRPLKPSEISSFWFKKGLRFIAAHPLDWFKLTIRKTYFFLNRYEPPDEYNIDFIRRNFLTALKFPLPAFGFVGALGIMGLFLFLRRNDKTLLLGVFAALYAASVIATTISDRYRLPAAVFLAVFAGGFIARLMERGFYKELKLMHVRFLSALPVAALCLLPSPLDKVSLEAQGWSQLVSMYYHDGEYSKALYALDRAFEADPAHVHAEAILKGALAVGGKFGNAPLAAKLYDKGMALYPDNALFYAGKGALLSDNGRYKEAIALFETAVRLKPDFTEVYRNLFFACVYAGERKPALEYGKKALALDPSASDIRAKLKQLNHSPRPRRHVHRRKHRHVRG